jgi:hypothetical protein
MQKARIRDAIEHGQYDENIPELVELSRQIFRADEVAKFSHRISASQELKAQDLIEVHLALLAKLRKPLELGWTTKGMHYFKLSGIKKKHIALALKTVQQEENTHFRSFFSASSVWLKLAQRLEPELFEAMQNKRYEEVTTENLKEGIDAELQAFKLENDKQARRVAERRVLKSPDIEQQIYDELEQKGQENDEEERLIVEEKLLKNPDMKQKVDAALEAIKLEYEEQARRVAERTVLAKSKIQREIDVALERTRRENDEEARRIAEKNLLENPDIKQQVDAALEAAKLEYEEDILRIVQKNVMDKKQEEIYMQFTQDVLAKRGLAHLLDKKWRDVV